MRPAAALVSVVIPCRDRGRVLEDAVDSVFAQTYAACELVVVDDGSTDVFTRRVLERFDWPRTTVFRQDARNGAAARNLGMRHARGRYVCCLEAGDRLAPTYLEKAVAVLDQTPAAAFAAAEWSTFGGAEIDVRPPDCGVAALLAGLLHPAGVVRGDAVREAGGFDEGLADGQPDHDLWLRIVVAGGQGRLLSERLVFHRGDAVADGAPRGPFLAPAYVRKHEALYTRHAPEVLRLRETLLANVWAARVAPAVAPPEPPLPGHAAGLQSTRQRVDELEVGLADARFQVAHLRASLSWRMTAPLRFVHRTLARLRGAER